MTTHRFTHHTTVQSDNGSEVEVKINLACHLPSNTHLHVMDPDRYDGEMWIEIAEAKDAAIAVWVPDRGEPVVSTYWRVIGTTEDLYGLVESYVDEHLDELMAEAVEDKADAADYAREQAYEWRMGR